MENRMVSYRNALPQLDGGLFVTDGGIETTLIFDEGLELPDFAAFDLLRRAGGEIALRKYYLTYAELALRFGAGLVLERATGRARVDWAARLRCSPSDLAFANRSAISMLVPIRDELARAGTLAVISGCVGPRGDGYRPDHVMSVEEARRYHRLQVETFAGTAADMVSAITMNYVEEAIGIARAACDNGIPAVISFTVETDGRLPTGQPLDEAIEEVDAETSSYPAYYMLNCAHPEHIRPALQKSWTSRLCGLRANASRKSHAELNESAELDRGDPAELARQYVELKNTLLPNLNVVGGCCGTDHRHVEHIAISMTQGGLQ